MNKLIPAVIAILAAQSAFAEQRENKPFSTNNGRTSAAAPGAPHIIRVTKPGGGMGSNGPAAAAAAAPAAGMAAAAAADHGRAITGGGNPRQTASRTSSGHAVHRGGKAFRAGARKADGGGVAGGGAGGTTQAPTYEEPPPPNYDKPGALIRTTGQLPKYEKAEEPRTHTVDAGEIVMDNRKAFNVGQAPSIQYGPRDTPPPPNPTTGGQGTSISANGPVTNTNTTKGGIVIGGTGASPSEGKGLQDVVNDAY